MTGLEFVRVLDESNSTIFQINLDTFVFKLPNLDTFTSNFLQSADKCVCSRRSPYCGTPGGRPRSGWTSTRSITIYYYIFIYYILYIICITTPRSPSLKMSPSAV